jgi:septum formation protein
MKTANKLILASTSPRRKELMKSLELDFEVIPGNYEEDMSLDMKPSELAMTLAKGKAENVAKRVEEGVVIGADTFVTYEGLLLGKPKNKDDAKRMLRMLSGGEQKVYSGIAVIDVLNKIKVVDYDMTIVKFRELSDEEIDLYIATGEPLDKAGAYGIQGLGREFIRSIEGSESNVIGLPLEKLKKIIWRIKWETKI